VSNPCIEAWAADGGKLGTRVAYIHWLYRCPELMVRQPRRQVAHFELGVAARSHYLHGDERFPMSDGRRRDYHPRMLYGFKAIKAARTEAEVWVRSRP